MKRLLLLSYFAVLAVLSSFLSLRITENVDWKKLTYARNACWEYVHCQTAWWVFPLITLSVFLPALLHLWFACSLKLEQLNHKKMLWFMLCSFAFTLGYFSLLRLVGGA